MISGIDHIGIAVSNLDEALRTWESAFDIKCIHREIVEDQKVEVGVLLAGDLRLEFICPTSADSSVAKFLQNRGEGIHHIALQTENAQKELDNLKLRSLKLIDETARNGAEETKIGFIHPRSLSSVLVELVERNSKK